jgi:NADH-quinone oxidoreductase subunit J
MELLLFYILASLMLASSFFVILSPNPVHSVLFIILVFCNASGLLLLLEAEFLALIFIVVYVGAIGVLFIFVVMMLNVKFFANDKQYLQYLPVASLIAMIFFVEVFLVFDNQIIGLFEPSTLSYFDWNSVLDSVSNIETLAQILYTHYFYFFILAGFILLVALVGAIVLTLQRRENVREQNISHQISRDMNNAVFMTQTVKR